MLLIVVLRLLLRRHWLALIVAVPMLSVNFAAYASDASVVGLAFPLASALLYTLIAVRFGLLPLVVARAVYVVVVHVPITRDLSHWSASSSNWALAVVVALAFFAFYASRAGQPLFGGMLEEKRAA